MVKISDSIFKCHLIELNFVYPNLLLFTDSFKVSNLEHYDWKICFQQLDIDFARRIIHM